MKTIQLATITAAVSAALFINAQAQDATAAPSATTASPAPAATQGGNTQDNSGGRRGNMQEFRQRMNERLKTELKATDEEWAVIQPLLEKVQEAQRATFSGRFGGFGGGRRGGPGGPGGPGAQGGDQGSGNTQGGGNNRPDWGGSAETQALRTTLDSTNSSDADIKAKLQALRDSRKKAAADLETARENLKKVLTLRQEATLVMMGILD